MRGDLSVETKTMLLPSLFEAVFNASSIASNLLSPTPEATILAVNDAFLKSSSRKREELVGVSVFEAFPSNPNDPEDTGEMVLRASLARVRETGKVDSMPVQRYPLRMQLANGEVEYEERFWSALNTPIFDDAGNIICIAHTTTDITDQVRSNAELRESEKRYRALSSASADVVYRMNPDWKQIRQLQGRGFLKDSVDQWYSWVDDYIPAEDQPLLYKTIDEAIRTKSTFELEHRVVRADGTRGWVLSRAVPMLDANGAIYEWIGAATDITERKEAEEKLKDADRRKDEFLAMLAHELRNPLAPIGAAAELLQMVKLDEARVRKTSQIIDRQVRHMTSLVDDLLDVSRVTRGLVELDKEPVDVSHIVTDAIEQVAPMVQARQHYLALHMTPDATIVLGDRKRLVQVLANILNNAAKYTHEGGTIRLCTQVDDSHVLIEIADTGIGMALELVGRAFDLFAQAERAADRSSGGLGLGLALVKSLVELHHGTVRCESEGVGKGSKFTICLPRLRVPQGRGTDQQDDVYTNNVTQSLRILVVDDNVDAATMLAMLLEASGHEVLVEHGSRQALERARQERPQVCLLDIGLPEIDGNELAQRLRAQAETAKSVLVAVTGYGQDKDRAQTLAAGFDHHLVKPVDTGRLAALLAKVGRS